MMAMFLASNTSVLLPPSPGWREPAGLMKNPTAYLKMRVLGAIDLAPGRTERDRIRHVAERSFVDEYGHAHVFTWRTIETWLVRYRKHGVTVMHNKPRSDKGALRNAFSEEALALVVRSADGLLRRTRNLCLACLLEAVRDQTKCVDLKQVNRVLLQPHWRNDTDFLPTALPS